MIITREVAQPIADAIVKALRAADRPVKIHREKIWIHRLEAIFGAGNEIEVPVVICAKRQKYPKPPAPFVQIGNWSRTRGRRPTVHSRGGQLDMNEIVAAIYAEADLESRLAAEAQERARANKHAESMLRSLAQAHPEVRPLISDVDVDHGLFRIDLRSMRYVEIEAVLLALANVRKGQLG